VSATGHKRRLLGETLVEAGVLSREQLTSALQQQRATGRLLGEILLEQGIITPQALVRTVAQQLGVPGCTLRHGLFDPACLDLIGQEEAERLKCLPMFKVHNTLTVAMAEPQSLPKIDRLQRLTGESDVDAFLASLQESHVSVVEQESVDEGPVADLDHMVAGSPVVNLVNVVLLTAIRDGASDIHIEPDRRGTRIRYRIDGRLRDLMRPPPGMHAAIVSRIKVIGKMDIAEKRLPQEGRVRIVAEKREIDLRVSSMPTLLGEKLVIRILDKENLHVRLEDLGFRPETLEAFRRMLRQPYGLVLVTGPTGSGKTTTLYSALDLLRSPERNILTVEDPVEYQLDLVNQVQVHPATGMTFARVLRSMLRQDPDVIMVGEIRDEHQRRPRRRRPPHRHGGGTLPPGQRPERRRGPAPRPDRLPGLRHEVLPRRRPPGRGRPAGPAEPRLPQGGRLRAVPQLRLPRPDGHLRGHGGHRRPPQDDSPGRSVAPLADPAAGTRMRIPPSGGHPHRPGRKDQPRRGPGRHPQR